MYISPMSLSSDSKTSPAPEPVGTPPRLRVLFLCTHNGARSQMAEGILRSLGGDRVEACSAGTAASRVHPMAIQVLAERGIDLRRQRSKSLDEYKDQRFDYVITVCDDAKESCPVFPGTGERLHWSLPDPSAAEEGEQERAFER
ncbi:MAG: ArsR family transcriptional regulator, arsenate/arsenite/antimonite-responsive transcriptional, partial [Acidobacteriota bacterium]|nr:ArsR family transcriptional regulator, arsenate/arsenite/antimonite-responsive transcriptional [Acidobacteriota bacterium]